MCHEGRLFPATATLIVLLLASAWPAAADPIPIPLSAFSGTEQVVRFSVSEESIRLPYSEGGATFHAEFGFVQRFVQSLNLQRPTPGGTATLAVTFSRPVTMAGFNFIDYYLYSPIPTVAAHLFADVAGLQPIGQINFGAVPAFQTAFVGFAAQSAFTRADISFTVPTAASWYIDDFRFDDAAAIPEPGTVSLILLGMGLLGSRMRHRTRRDKVQSHSAPTPDC